MSRSRPDIVADSQRLVSPHLELFVNQVLLCRRKSSITLVEGAVLRRQFLEGEGVTRSLDWSVAAARDE